MTEHEKATPRPVALNDIPEDLQIEYMCGFLCDDYVYRLKRELIERIARQQQSYDASRALIEQMRNALVAIEFCIGGFCPVCRGGRKSRHGASCDIGQLLAAAEKFLEGRNDAF